MSKNNDNYQTVVQGEASESDDETEVPVSTKGRVVSGEASESDEEPGSPNTDSGSKALPPIIVTNRSISTLSDTSADIPTLMTPRAAEAKASKPKYDTLLHRKLRESNLNFHSHMVDNCSQIYLAASRNLHSTTQQLNRSHSMVQDVSHNLRLLTNDLFHMEDKIDIISSCQLLPNIAIP